MSKNTILVSRECLPSGDSRRLNSKTAWCVKYASAECPRTCDYYKRRQEGDVDTNRYHPAMLGLGRKE